MKVTRSVIRSVALVVGIAVAGVLLPVGCGKDDSSLDVESRQSGPISGPRQAELDSLWDGQNLKLYLEKALGCVDWNAADLPDSELLRVWDACLDVALTFQVCASVSEDAWLALLQVLRLNPDVAMGSAEEAVVRDWHRAQAGLRRGHPDKMVPVGRISGAQSRLEITTVKRLLDALRQPDSRVSRLWGITFDGEEPAATGSKDGARHAVSTSSSKQYDWLDVWTTALAADSTAVCGQPGEAVRELSMIFEPEAPFRIIYDDEYSLPYEFPEFTHLFLMARAYRTVCGALSVILESRGMLVSEHVVWVRAFEKIDGQSFSGIGTMLVGAEDEAALAAWADEDSPAWDFASEALWGAGLFAGALSAAKAKSLATGDELDPHFYLGILADCMRRPTSLEEKADEAARLQRYTFDLTWRSAVIPSILDDGPLGVAVWTHVHMNRPDYDNAACCCVHLVDYGFPLKGLAKMSSLIHIIDAN